MNSDIELRIESQPSGLVVTVRDCGPGVPDELLPRLAQPFFRVEDARDYSPAGGVGLGLSIVRHIVEMHGGTVHAASEGEGKGSTFRVLLPLMIVHEQGMREAREHPRTDTAKALTSLDKLTGIRVLAIDDEEDSLRLLRDVLVEADTPEFNAGTALVEVGGTLWVGSFRGNRIVILPAR